MEAGQTVRVDVKHRAQFAPVAPRKRETLRGRPELFAHLVGDAEAVASLKTKLAEADAETFACVGLQSFADALGIRNAVTSYEYLCDGETDEIDGWDQFVHIPDLASEEAKLREAEAAVRAKKAVMTAEGLLLKGIGGLRGMDRPSPWCCRAPEAASFLIAWSGHADGAEKACELERYGPPWEASPAPFSMSIDGQLQYDAERDWVLFAGLEGLVRYLDLSRGRSGVLFEPPEDWPILQVELSIDRSALAVRY
jgi:hypothetical protein